ncbi:O-antigen ligase family protein [Novosphingobium sp. BL-52-GroH]|uniref:O-antigen ligase family protein n=1 Tax=Novosphingobium sp. BL-52-GroH TaxID=3349877 RepID=UPI00384D4E7F
MKPALPRTTRPVAPSFQSNSELFLACAAIALFLLSGSRFLELAPGGEIVRLVCLLLEIAMAAYGIFIALSRKYLAVALFSLMIMIAVPFYAYVFSNASGLPFVPASGGDYLPIGMIALLYLVLRNGQAEPLLNFIFKLSLVYALVYIALWFGVYVGVIVPGEDSQIVLRSGGGIDRGLRLVLSNSFAVFGTCVATASLFRFLQARSIVTFIIFAVCLYLSGSRFISLLTMAFVGFYAISQNARLTRAIFFGIFSIGFIFTTYVVAVHSYNPFNGFVTDLSSKADVSAWARWKDIDLANRLIPEHWLFGLGIPNGPKAYEPITHVGFFYPQDIGLLGVFMMFGVFGFLFYGVIAYAACFSHVRLRVNNASLKIGLGLAGAVMVVYSLLAPVFIGNAIPFAALFLALMFWAPGRGVKIKPKFKRHMVSRVELI